MLLLLNLSMQLPAGIALVGFFCLIAGILHYVINIFNPIANDAVLVSLLLTLNIYTPFSSALLDF